MNSSEREHARAFLLALPIAAELIDYRDLIVIPGGHTRPGEIIHKSAGVEDVLNVMEKKLASFGDQRSIKNLDTQRLHSGHVLARLLLSGHCDVPDGNRGFKRVPWDGGPHRMIPCEVLCVRRLNAHEFEIAAAFAYAVDPGE